MPIILDSFKAPFRNLVLEGDYFSSEWQWFFRRIQERLYPLGIERTQVLINGMEALSFATSDVDTTADTITEAAHPFYTGLRGRFSSDDTLPIGLSSSFDQYLINQSATLYSAADTEQKSIAGTKVDITTTGVGTHTFTPYAYVNGARFNKNGITAAFFEYLIQRVTTGAGAVELTEVGFLIFVYEPVGKIWTKVAVSVGSPDNAGVTISILSDGHVTYTSTTVTGTASISSLFWRARTMTGKNISYSKVNR